MAISGIGQGGQVTKLLQSAGGARPKSVAGMLETMDSDKSGSVSKQEFVAFGEKMKANGPKGPGPGQRPANAPAMPSADELFGAADKNADESLSVDELSSMLAKAETQRPATSGPSARRSHGARSNAAGPTSGPGGSPPTAASGTKIRSSSNATDPTSSDPADTNGDGTVSTSEHLIYDMSHPAQGA